MTVPGLVQTPGDAKNPDRVRTSLEQICAILNSLLLSGEIVLTGPSEFAFGGAGSGTVKSVANGTGLVASPDPITTNGTLSLANTGVAAGNYSFANLTLNAQGQATAASNGSIGATVTAGNTSISNVETFNFSGVTLSGTSPDANISVPSLSVNDGTNTVTNVDNLSFSGAAVTGSGGNATVSITGGGGGSDPITSIYPAFTVSGSSDEFSGTSFTGWTAVNSGSHNPTIIEKNNVLSLLHPGSDASGELHAYMKQPTITTGSLVECGLKGFGFDQNFNLWGVIYGDGDTYGSGNQAACYFNPQQSFVSLSAWTGYNNLSSAGNHQFQTSFLASDLFLRLVYSASNQFQGYASPDGVSWWNFSGNVSITMTPTWAGFFVSTYGGTAPFVFSFRYCRFA